VSPLAHRPVTARDRLSRRIPTKAAVHGVVAVFVVAVTNRPLGIREVVPAVFEEVRDPTPVLLAKHARRVVDVFRLDAYEISDRPADVARKMVPTGMFNQPLEYLGGVP